MCVSVCICTRVPDKINVHVRVCVYMYMYITHACVGSYLATTKIYRQFASYRKGVGHHKVGPLVMNGDQLPN